MAEILKDWLSQTLERPVTWEAEEFGNMMKNGHVIATVLRSYHVINDEKHYIIRASNEEADIKNNWKYLREWLKEVEVNLTDDDLNNVMMGKGSSLLRLFYQLFLHLDKRDRINFIKRERKMVSSLVEKLENRFTVNKVTEEREPFIDYLSKPLLDERQFIEWQKRKTKEIKESFDYLHHKYSKIIGKIEESKFQKPFVKKGSHRILEKNEDIDKFERQHPCKYHNYTYEELMALEEKALQRKKSLVDSDWANEYMSNLFQKMRKRSDSEEFQRQISSALSNSLWNACVDEEESKADMELAKKVMKLSQFEKQMCTQIMETKQQARNLVKNRIQGEIEYTEQREQQLNIFFDNLKDKIDSGNVEIDFEQKRQNQLHKRLFAEKMKRKRQIYYDICYETLLALIDYAVKFGYFKKLMEDDVPQHFIYEWKCLFFKQQPIFEVLTPTEDILKLRDAEESSSFTYEEVVYLERDRQQVLNDCEFKEYLHYLYPWNLDVLIPNYDPESEERTAESLGLNILGHAVFTLLEVKYPYPSKRLPADLPDYTSKVLLRSLPDKSLSNILETLLNSQKISVVRLESVINYCLREYQIDMIGRTEIQLAYDSFLAATQEEETKELIKSMKSEDEALARSREIDTSGPLLSPLPNTKHTQTPKCLPEDDIIMSPAASLGQYAYDALTAGEPLTDYLIAAMIVEYLKHQEDIVGFVIINYPNTYLQVQILEEAFVGFGPPDFEELNDNDDELLEESILKHRLKEIDVYKEVRVSKIVKDPHKRRTDEPFESYFTAYINLKQTSDISEELVIWELTQENSDIIDRFYAVMGINYSLFYEVIDRDLIAQICKFVIGDFSIPIKSFEELFDENIVTQIEFPNSEVKRINSKMVKSDIITSKSKEKVRKNSKLSRTTLETELEIIKAPLSFGDVEQNRIKTLESMIAQENKSKSLHSVDKIKVLPGEEDWVYGILPIPDTLGVALASYWEEFEKSYVDSIQQLFFTTRLQMNYVIPYTRFLKDKMIQIVTLPSEKQNLVTEFQSKYNEFKNDWRPLNVARNEWHCRVKELQNKLYNICDQRKVFAQEKRHALICDNWTIEELTILANTYISLMQMELNRSIMTFQILNDFYITMLRGAPPSDRLSSKDLTKIYRETESSHSSKKGGDEKLYKHLKAVFQELFIKSIEFDFDNNPFNFIIENNVKFATKIVKDLGESFRSLISKENSEKAKITPTKKREGNGSTESYNHEENLKENALKCLEEWPVGVNGEMLRFNLRILALQHKCYADMKLFSNQVLKAFIEIQNLIDTYYTNEVLAVDRLCKYFHMAIEKGRKIPESLLLEYDTLIIDNNVLQFSPSVETIVPQSKSEIKRYSYFKTNQLARLRSQFKLVAPTGIIMHKAFIYLLQDFILFGKESKEGPLFPDVWKNIDPEQVQKLVFSLFGETAYVDWREFLIYCLQLSFPTIHELLEVRKKFRCNDLDSTELISRDNFIKEEFWFDKDFVTEDKQDLLKLNLIKHFLFELYETEEDKMNYSAFLLAFCKNIDPIKGFIAALSMAVGQEICHSLDDCGDIVTYLINEKKYRDECLACALKCTEQFINKLIQRVISICEGTTVEEVMYTESVPEEKKGKKKKSNKVKKIDGNQSGRSDNSQKRGSQYKMSPSIVVSQLGMICPPCERPLEKPKEPEKEPVVKPPVEEPPIPYRDPNICLEVSQTVIWNVLKICLPWHFKILPETTESIYVQQAEEVLKSLEKDTDNKDVYVCKLVADPKFCKMLHKVKKFTAVDLLEEIITMI
ncbi:sperm flagellar protein 2 [Papilio machaon]|uniref:sperm flagellar protein 2 n=1 Tax=Papilio machaon TaxID=76193 RepID=UPI001E663354|nr:sperm flagellar protein 2 [Papilio machaon]